MSTLPQDIPISPNDLDIRAESAETVVWQGRESLRLENGLALVPGLQAADGNVEVLIGTEGPAYPGVAFRVADVANYELAYAVPHVSGQWDALQYDPVFHGSNTWQMFHGPCYQQSAQVPTGVWFRLRVDFCAGRAAVSVDGQPPLLVERLAHPTEAGLLGLWTFRPATFCDLRVSTGQGAAIPRGRTPTMPKGLVREWFVEGYGLVRSEPHGPINLNRVLPTALGQVRLLRRFQMASRGTVRLEFGFSDALSLKLDERLLFEGENTFHGFADRAARGYVELGTHSLQETLEPGAHCLTATLQVSEPFGWGLALAAHGTEQRWLPAELG
jgi:hypothetical protein